MAKLLVYLLVIILYEVLGCLGQNSSQVTICPTFKDYGKKQPNSNCHKEPIGNMEEWIKGFGCNLEKYEIITEDQYILTMYRTYCGEIRGKYPILIGHGILGNASIFFIGKEKSPGFAVVKEGYEVWMLNFRGTSSSRHTTLSKDDKKFWKFSWNEMGVYDYPAAIKFIRDYDQKHYGTFRKIVMIGTSMGSQALTILTSELPDFCEIALEHQIHIAPVHSYLRNQPTHRAVATIWPVVKKLLYKLFPSGKLNREFKASNSSNSKITMRIVQVISGLVVGFNLESIDPEVYPVWQAAVGDSGSVQTLIHSLQNIATFGFRKYDYGPLNNLKLYRSIKPPKYKIAAIKVNTTYFTSKNDGFANLKDTEDFFHKLPKSVQAGLYVMEPKKFCHIDYTAYNKYSRTQFTQPHLLPVLRTINPLD